MATQTETQLLAAIAARRRRGIADMGAELRRRIADLGDMRLDTVERQAAFAEVFDAFRPPHFDFYALPDECAVATADSTIRITGVIVDTANRQAVGQLVRTIALDQRLAWHDFLSLQQPYRANGLTLVLIWQSFAFYDTIGVFAAIVHAALETGRWYWGRLGFEFIDTGQRNAVRRWGRAVVAALGDPVEVSTLVEARQWALVGSTPPVVETTLEEIAQRMPRARWRHFRGQSIGGYLGVVADANRIRFDEQIPLGRAIMLSGPDWWGYFPLGDRARRSQLEVSARAKLRQVAAAAAPRGSGAAP
jgi:hypothetical protein